MNLGNLGPWLVKRELAFAFDRYITLQGHNSLVLSGK